MKIHKRTAAGLAAALAAGSLAALTLGVAPAQAATGSTAGLNGSPANQIAVAAYGATGAINVTAIQNGANVDVSASVATGPNNPISEAAAGSYRLDAILRVDGAANARGSNWVAGTPGAAVVPVGTAYYPSGTSWNWTVPGLAAGLHNFTLTDLIMDSNGGTSGGAFAANASGYVGFDAWYNRGTTTAAIVTASGDYAPVGPTETVDVEGAEIASLTGTIAGDNVPAGPPPTLKGGEEITITGNALWNSANTNIYIRMCSPGGYPTGCSPLGVSSTIAPTVSTSTAGGVLNTVRGPLIDSSGFGTGPIDLVVVQTATPMGAVQNFAIMPINYAPNSVDPATVSGPTANVGAGAAQNITGSGWYPGETVTLTAGTNTTTDVADANGNIAAPLAASAGSSSWNAEGIGGRTATLAFTMSSDSCTVTDPLVGCDTVQNITGEITAGTLSQAAAGTLIDLGDVATSASAGALDGAINQVTVTDARGGTEGWSLTAVLDGPLEAPSGSIDQGNLTADPTCVGQPGSASGVANAAPQTFAGTVTLCVNDGTADSAGDTSGGVYDVNADLDLVVPAFQATGVYGAVMTITLI